MPGELTTQPDPARTAAVTPEEREEWLAEIQARADEYPWLEHPGCGMFVQEQRVRRLCDALAASEARLAEVEREREALRRMARQLIDVTGADGFRWYVDGPAELGDVVARAGTIIGYTPWERPAARSGGEAGQR